MSLSVAKIATMLDSFPRPRGDEPDCPSREHVCARFSPPARG